MSEKFTPAPWAWVKDKNTDGYYGLYSGDTPVVYPQRCNDGNEGLAWFSTDESYYGETALKESDAALIAAAPEMYAMLDKILNSAQPASDFYEEADALLAKARGEV